MTMAPVMRFITPGTLSANTSRWRCPNRSIVVTVACLSARGVPRRFPLFSGAGSARAYVFAVHGRPRVGNY